MSNLFDACVQFLPPCDPLAMTVASAALAVVVVLWPAVDLVNLAGHGRGPWPVGTLLVAASSSSLATCVFG